MKLQIIEMNCKLKIALIWEKFGPYHLARLSALKSIQSLNVFGIEVFSSSSTYSDLFNSDSSFVESQLIRLNLSNSVSSLNLKLNIFDVLTSLKPNVIFVPGWSMKESLCSILWALENKVPFVIMSDSSEIDFDRGYFKEFIKSIIVSSSSAGFVAGSPQKRYLSKLGVHKDFIFKGYDAVDNNFFMFNPFKTSKDKSEFILKYELPDFFILCIARLVEKKNLKRLILAHKIHVEKFGLKSFKLVIVGPGPQFKELLDLIYSENLSDFVFLKGAIENSEMPQLYNCAKGFILASTTDQWGLVINEAMCSSLPILISNTCGSAEDLVIENVNGFKFNPLSILEISNKINYLFQMNQESRVLMGIESKRIISNWGLDFFCKNFENSTLAAYKNKVKTSFLTRIIIKILIFN